MPSCAIVFGQLEVSLYKISTSLKFEKTAHGFTVRPTCESRVYTRSNSYNRHGAEGISPKVYVPTRRIASVLLLKEARLAIDIPCHPPLPMRLSV